MLNDKEQKQFKKPKLSRWSLDEDGEFQFDPTTHSFEEMMQGNIDQTDFENIVGKHRSTVLWSSACLLIGATFILSVAYPVEAVTTTVGTCTGTGIGLISGKLLRKADAKISEYMYMGAAIGMLAGAAYGISWMHDYENKKSDLVEKGYVEEKIKKSPADLYTQTAFDVVEKGKVDYAQLAASKPGMMLFRL